MIIIGLLLIFVPLFIMVKFNELNTKRTTRILLNILLCVISFLYIALSILLKTEPFNFDIIRVGDYFISAAVIFVFSPFLWITLYYFCRRIFKSIRVSKNAKLKSDNQYMYYRDDLNKVSPSIVMFASTMDVDIRKSISATILKLKLTGHLQKNGNKLQCTDKKENGLLETEKMILNSIKKDSFDKKVYKQLIEKETLDYKYIRKNRGGKIVKTIKILITIIMPIVLIFSSQKFDDFVFEKYPIQVLDDVAYVKIYDEKDIDNLYNNEIKNKDDYYFSYGEFDGKREKFYSYDLVKANKFEYTIVKTRIVLEILDSLFLLVSIISVFVAIFMLIQQLIYFNKNYIRTIKGNELLNKAYALKNFLKDFSIIKKRTEEELILWEYYLIYAVILDVNVQIEDTIIKDYLKSI